MSELNKKIKICFIAPKAYPLFDMSIGSVFGGAEVDLYYLATELAKDEKFDVSFITADYGQQMKQRIENVRIIKSLTFKENPFSGAIKIWRAMKLAEADIYMIKTISAGMFLVALFCRVNRKFFLYRTAHQDECDGTYIKKHPCYARLYKWSLKTAVRVFAQNKKDSSNLKRTTSVNSQTIPNGHRLRELSETKRTDILWVGRSAGFKRPHLFMDLAKNFPQEKFVMICQKATGDDNYEKLLAMAGNVENLKFIERIPFNQINEFFQSAKIFVNTSSGEGFPNTFIQACIAGTAILSMNVNPDRFLDEYNCGLCSDGDWNKLTDALKLLLYENRYIELGKNARKYAQDNHDVTRIVTVYKQMLKDVVVQKNKETK
jgi:glycosyltransferase involved in cell wall biosynthesis